MVLSGGVLLYFAGGPWLSGSPSDSYWPAFSFALGLMLVGAATAAFFVRSERKTYREITAGLRKEDSINDDGGS